MQIGVNNQAKKVTTAYIGINNIAKKVKSIYVGISNVAKKIFSSDKLIIFYKQTLENVLIGNYGTIIANDKYLINFDAYSEEVNAFDTIFTKIPVTPVSYTGAAIGFVDGDKIYRSQTNDNRGLVYGYDSELTQSVINRNGNPIKPYINEAAYTENFIFLDVYYNGSNYSSSLIYFAKNTLTASNVQTILNKQSRKNISFNGKAVINNAGASWGRNVSVFDNTITRTTFLCPNTDYITAGVAGDKLIYMGNGKDTNFSYVTKDYTITSFPFINALGRAVGGTYKNVFMFGGGLIGAPNDFTNKSRHSLGVYYIDKDITINISDDLPHFTLAYSLEEEQQFVTFNDLAIFAQGRIYDGGWNDYKEMVIYGYE